MTSLQLFRKWFPQHLFDCEYCYGSGQLLDAGTGFIKCHCKKCKEAGKCFWCEGTGKMTRNEIKDYWEEQKEEKFFVNLGKFQ